jgi:hypothetical protein
MGRKRAIDALPALSDRVTWALLLGVLAATALIQLRSVLHHDPAWLIHGTETFLDGGALYREVFELNPPLIFYLTVPPVWLARQLHVSDLDMFVLYVSALIALSLTAARAVLRNDPVVPESGRNALLLTAAVALAVCPAGNFGQREHLMLVFALPGLLLTMRRARRLPTSARLAWVIGALVVPGLALKPHFLLLQVAAECVLLWHTRSLRNLLRPETLALAAGLMLYLAAIAWFTPDYLGTIVPFGMAVYEQGFDASWGALLLRPASLLLPLLLALHAATRRGLGAPQLGDLLCTIAVCCLAIFLAQRKGWSYQAYPLDATLFLGFGVVLLQALRVPRRAWVAAVAAGLLVATGTAGAMQRYRNPFMQQMAPLAATLPALRSMSLPRRCPRRFRW